MLHPVGPQPHTVYWRRRIMVLGGVVLLLVLIVLTVFAVTSDDGAKSSAGSSGHHPSSRQHSSPKQSSPASPKPSQAALSCTAAQLTVSAVAKKSYRVGAKPTLDLQVINTGKQSCVQDLADKAVELRIYNGEARVWSSHDCGVQAGTKMRTLAADRSVRIGIVWMGLTSQHGCAGTQQRVGAGTYTLYALLSGHKGKSTQFELTDG